jgi:hypothetical protein
MIKQASENLKKAGLAVFTSDEVKRNKEGN